MHRTISWMGSIAVVAATVMATATTAAADEPPTFDVGPDAQACDRTVLLGTVNPPRCRVDNYPDDVELVVDTSVLSEGTIFTTEVKDTRSDSTRYFPATFGWELESYHPWGINFGSPGWYPMGLPPIRRPGSFAHPTDPGKFRKLSACGPTDRTCTWQLVTAPAVALNPGQPVPAAVTLQWNYLGVALDGGGRSGGGGKWAEAQVAIAPVYDHVPTASFTVGPANNGDHWAITVDGTGSTDEDGPIRNYLFSIDGVLVESPVATVSIPHDPTETSREITIILGVDGQRFGDWETRTVTVPMGAAPAPAGYLVELPPVGGEDIDPVLDGDGRFLGFSCGGATTFRGGLGSIAAMCPKGLGALLELLGVDEVSGLFDEALVAFDPSAITGLLDRFMQGWNQGTFLGTPTGTVPGPLRSALQGLSGNLNGFLGNLSSTELPPGDGDTLTPVVPDAMQGSAMATDLAGLFTDLETLTQVAKGTQGLMAKVAAAGAPTSPGEVTVVNLPAVQGRDIDPVVDRNKRVVGFSCGGPFGGLGCPPAVAGMLGELGLFDQVTNVAGTAIAEWRPGELNGVMKPLFDEFAASGQLFDGLKGGKGGVPPLLDTLQSSLAKLTKDAQGLGIKPPAPGTAPVFRPKPAVATTMANDLQRMLQSTQSITQLTSGMQQVIEGLRQMVTPPAP